MRNRLKQLPKIRYSRFNKAIAYFGVALLIILSILTIHWTNTYTLPPVVAGVTRGIAVVIGAYFAASLVVRLTITRIVKFFGDSVQIEQKILLTKTYTGMVYGIATIVVLGTLGVTLQSLTLFVGLIATAVAFALRDILMSYLAWYILLTKQPFRIGDYIKIGDEQGVVQHIGTFYVLIDDSPERVEDYVRIPNKLFLEKPITNYGKNLVPETIKLKIDAYPANYDKKLSRLKKNLSAISQINPEISLDVYESKPILVVRYYINISERRNIKNLVLREVLEEFGSEKK